MKLSLYNFRIGRFLLLEINLKKFGLEDSIHGKMMFPINDSVIGACLREFGEFSENENILLGNFIEKKDFIIDIGANIGTQTLSFSNKVGPNGQVIAFEPQNIISQCLQTNLTINDIDNVKVYNMGVSSDDGWARINDEKYSKEGRYGEAGIQKKGSLIKVIKLNSLKLKKCDLIKMDVEGHEWNIINGGQNFIKEHNPIIYLEAKKNEGTKKFLKWFMDNGWICYWHFAWWFRKNNFKNNKNIKFLGKGDMNVLAVPKERRQPDFLPVIQKFDESWNQESYANFFIKNKIEVI